MLIEVPSVENIQTQMGCHMEVGFLSNNLEEHISRKSSLPSPGDP
jgi:hypothetical protein